MAKSQKSGKIEVAQTKKSMLKEKISRGMTVDGGNMQNVDFDPDNTMFSEHPDSEIEIGKSKKFDLEN